ncbi:DUF4062 domain-containing protein [Herbiconiux sp. CPCC 205763]|uniref:DUF4062 domain-containing protein n=1 Tax=Herbiconiux aconitum TaxID=2970913 RepID=A0ABT2GMA8_9MICO|nr:DUF4062 domain-containing protein [Herbiconiux aconitum]MCS5717367.1 DUF4062 domain-containing protein [Herbiconiux aconitum]
MGPTEARIRTPDQRLRVFVSSTLKELAPERRSARTAIERLQLAPVMFELGARPHPPRELYRAYLAQSDVFVGLYWERYGWVAPEEEVSGLEDEYLLAPWSMPKLMYIKQPAPAREARLDTLLDRVRDDDTASFKYFSDSRELGRLLTADLATLLAERFDQSRGMSAVSPVPADLAPGASDTAGAKATSAPPAPADEAPAAFSPTPPARSVPLPAQVTALIGRAREVDDVSAMLRRPGTRLITLTGPGGIGKSRLAIEVAERLAPDFADGAAFIDLSAVHDPALVPLAIAQSIGVRDTGDAPLLEKVETALRERRILLVLDNFEQVLDAATLLAALLAMAPGVVAVVTSRSLLHISAEKSYEVGPLGLPDWERHPSLGEVTGCASVSLFVERVHAVKPDFEIDADNVEAVARICDALDGVPLALELAAARMRVLTPTDMLARLDRRLPLLVGGARDLPARQQTLRSTIEWSTQLLGDSEKALLARLGVFEGGFSLEAAEAVSGASGPLPALPDTLSLVGLLVDASLVSQHDRGTRSRFSMLATVREYALEQLGAQPDDALDILLERHAEFYIALGRESEFALEGPEQRDWMARLTDDRDNLRATARHLLDTGELDRCADFAWTLYVYWWVGGHLGEVRGWMQELLDASEGRPSPRARAIALYFTQAITFWQDPDGRVAQGLTESAELFRQEGEPSGEALALVSLALAVLANETPDPARADDALETSLGLFRDSGDQWGEAMALVSLGRVALLQQKTHAALNRFEESLMLARKQGDQLGETIALHHLGWARLLLGDVPAAGQDFGLSLESSARMGHDEGIAYGLEGLVALAAMAGDADRAGRLEGAATVLRERSGIYNAPAFTFHAPLVAQLRASSPEAARAYDRAQRAGREEPTDAVVGYALAGVPSGEADARAAAPPPAATPPPLSEKDA